MCIISYEMMCDFWNSEDLEESIEKNIEKDSSFARFSNLLSEKFARKFSDEDIKFLLFSVSLSVFAISIVFLFPGYAHAALDGVKKKVTENEDFFLSPSPSGDRKIRKLYKEFDYRKSPKVLVNTRNFQKVVSTKTPAITVKRLNMELPTVDLASFFSKEKVKQVLESRTIEKFTNNDILSLLSEASGIDSFVNAISHLSKEERVLLLRGGVGGFVLSKFADKLGNKVENWVSNRLDADSTQSKEKQAEEKRKNFLILLPFLEIFKSNPVILLSTLSWLWINRKRTQIQNGIQKRLLPLVLAETFGGERRSYKYYLIKAISLREPYIYLFSGAIFIIVNREVLSKLFRRELTIGDVIHNITKSFTASLSKTEIQSLKKTLKEMKEVINILERDLSECKMEKFSAVEELKNRTAELYRSEKKFSILNAKAKILLEYVGKMEAMKNRELIEKLPKED